MKTAFLWISLLLAVALFAVHRVHPQAVMGAHEAALLELANGERAARGLAPLKWSPPLALAAQEHAVRLAHQHRLSHQYPGEPDPAERASRFGVLFSAIAENIAEGSNTEKIHQQWMNSPPHRANLLDPKLDSVGIATEDRAGTLFAVEDFCRAMGNLSLSEQEKIVASQLSKRGLKLLDQAKNARQSCALAKGDAGNLEPSYLVRYATPDLQSLPSMLDQRIQTGKYHSAVVGACPPKPKIGFNPYRVAVILYE